MLLGVRQALVDGGWVPGDVDVRDGRVVAVGADPAPGATGFAAPGFVDVHVNGMAGVDFLHADADGYARAEAAMARTGVVAYRPTFITAPVEDTLAALRTVAALPPTRGPERLGVHLEGPFLSPRWPGAHDPGDLRAIDDALVDALLAAGPVTHVTLAPELPDGLVLVRRLAAAGVLVSIGHTDADAPTAYAAFDAGARTLTHVHNAHRRWAARDVGPAGAALARPDVVVQLIGDGVHLAPETTRLAFAAAPGRVALVTDAMEAAGLPAGPYRLGDREVTVAGGAARLADGTLAGSVATMDAVVRATVAAGVELPTALLAASAVPAGLLGRADLGVLRPGAPANLVVCDDDLHVRRTLVAGDPAT